MQFSRLTFYSVLHKTNLFKLRTSKSLLIRLIYPSSIYSHFSFMSWHAYVLTDRYAKACKNNSAQLKVWKYFIDYVQQGFKLEHYCDRENKDRERLAKQEEQMLKWSIFAITYKAVSQSSPLNNQTSELFHAALQHNDCTSSSFPVTLWPWVNIKVIQTGINL